MYPVKIQVVIGKKCCLLCLGAVNVASHYLNQCWPRLGLNELIDDKPAFAYLNCPVGASPVLKH